jgi:hypothetical protein
VRTEWLPFFLIKRIVLTVALQFKLTLSTGNNIATACRSCGTRRAARLSDRLWAFRRFGV